MDVCTVKGCAPSVQVWVVEYWGSEGGRCSHAKAPRNEAPERPASYQSPSRLAIRGQAMPHESTAPIMIEMLTAKGVINPAPMYARVKSKYLPHFKASRQPMVECSHMTTGMVLISILISISRPHQVQAHCGLHALSYVRYNIQASCSMGFSLQPAIIQAGQSRAM